MFNKIVKTDIYSTYHETIVNHFDDSTRRIDIN